VRPKGQPGPECSSKKYKTMSVRPEKKKTKGTRKSEGVSDDSGRKDTLTNLKKQKKRTDQSTGLTGWRMQKTRGGGGGPEEGLTSKKDCGAYSSRGGEKEDGRPRKGKQA